MHRRPLKTVVNIILSLILILSMNVIPSFAAGYTPGTYELTGTMYVRSGPDKSYKSLGALKKGTTIEVSAVKNTKWGQIDYKGKEGYVSLIYSKKVKGQIKKTETHPTPRPTTVPKPTGAPKPTSAPKPTASPRPTTAPSSSGTKYVLTGNLNVRSGPGTQYPSYGYLKKGDSVEVYGIENTKWGQIAYQGKKAYLSLSYAKKDTSVSAPVKSIVPKDTSSVSAEPVKGTLTVENIDSESGTAKIVLSGIPSGRKIEGASLTVSSTSSNAHTYEGTRNADGTYSFSFNYKNHKMSYGIFTMEAKAKEGSSVTKCGSGTFQMKKPKMAATLTYEGTYMKEYDLTQLMGLRNNLVELRASIVNKTTGAVWPEHTFYTPRKTAEKARFQLDLGYYKFDYQKGTYEATIYGIYEDGSKVKLGTITYTQTVDKPTDYYKKIGRMTFSSEVKYSADLYDTNAQRLVDQENAAAWIPLEDYTCIADHNYQGTSNVKNAVVNKTKMYIAKTDGKKDVYVCARNTTGYNKTYYLANESGKDIKDEMKEKGATVVIYTCMENSRHVRITMWKKVA